MAAILAMYIPCIVFAFVFSFYWLFRLVLVVWPTLWADIRSKLSKGKRRRSDTRKAEHPEIEAPFEKPANGVKRISDSPKSDDSEKGTTDEILRRMSTMTQHCTVVWSNLGCAYRTANGLNTVLEGVCGSVRPREMMAVLGPSGSGKTTLLDILAQRKTVGVMQGDIMVNGKPITKSFIPRTAYVFQEDNFIPSFTVKETMRMYAALILPKKMSKQEKKQRCEEVLAVMGLSREENTLVGGYLPGGILLKGLSGGERKRLSLATGIVAFPSVIFLDEPTSGLDSFAALNVMQYMRNIADNGHVIITSIHQPRSAIWSFFDTTLVLSKGLQLYFGPREDVVPWFSDHLSYPYEPLLHGLPSDWVMDLVNIGFDKPQKYFGKTMSTDSDLKRAAGQYHAQYLAKGDVAEEENVVNGRPHSAPFVNSANAASQEAKQLENGFQKDSVHGQANDSADTLAFTTDDRARFDKILSTHEPKGIAERWRGLLSPSDQQAALRHRASWFMQFRVLMHRQYLVITRNPADVAGRMIVFAGLAILVGLLYYDLDQKLIDLRLRLNVAFISMIIFLLLPFVYMSLLTSEKQHYIGDLSAKLYRPSAYYLSRHAVSIPFSVLNVLVFLLIVYGMVDFRLRALQILGYCLVGMLLYLIACQVLDLAATIMPNQDSAFFLAIVWTAIQILFTGFFIRFADMLHWISYLRYINAFSYAYQGTIVSQFKGQEFSCAEGLSPALVNLLPLYIQNSTYSFLLTLPTVTDTLRSPGDDCVVQAASLLNWYDITWSYGAIVGYLIGYLVVLHILTYTCFAILSRREKR